MKTAMIAAVAYARRGVQAAISPAIPPSRPATSSPWRRNLGTAPISFEQAGDRIGRDQDAPDEKDHVRRELDDQQRGDQATELGQRVVGAGQHAREVERQDAVALVAPEQLGCLGRAEQHDQDADDAVVARVADRRGVPELSAGRPRLRAERREPDREDSRQDREAGEREWRDLGPTATPDPETGPDRLREEREDRAATTQPRPVVGLVAEVVDAAARTARAARGLPGRLRRRAAHDAPPLGGDGPGLDRRLADDAAWAAVAGTSSRNRSSRLWRRCSRRTSASPRSAMLSRTMSYCAFLGDRQEDRPAVGHGLQSAPDERTGQRVRALLDLDREDARPLGERAERSGAQEPSGVDRDQEVAGPLDLAEQMAGDDDRDAELGAGPPDEREHLVTAGRVEAVGRLVEQEQARTVDERLGELDPLLHPGRVAADRPVALLVQADVTQDLGGPLARGRLRQTRHPGHVRDEVGRRGVGREAVVLGHVADELADRRALGAHVEVHHRRLARGRREQTEQDLDQRALAGAVGPDQADDPGFELESQAVERDHAAWVPFRQIPKGDEAHDLFRVPVREPRDVLSGNGRSRRPGWPRAAPIRAWSHRWARWRSRGRHRRHR